MIAMNERGNERMTITAKLHLMDEMKTLNQARVDAMKTRAVVKIIYNAYSMNGEFLGRREYFPKSKDDYNRVIGIIERNPEFYEIENTEHGYLFAE